MTYTVAKSFVLICVAFLSSSDGYPFDPYADVNGFPFIVLQADQYCSKTPAGFEKMFSDSCKSFQVTNCDSAWKEFSGAFSGRDPHDVMPKDYEKYFNVLPIIAGQDQNLFWSGTFPVVEILSGMNDPKVVTSVNSPSGAILNKLGSIYWCGKKGGGIDYQNDCLCSVTGNFWAQFSTEFAYVAKGVALWLGNGDRSGGAYDDKESFFAKYELPNLSTTAVKEVAAIVQRKGGGSGETCGTKTLATLESDVKKRGFRFTCYHVHTYITDNKAIANCVAKVIKDIQQGRVPPTNSDCKSLEIQAHEYRVHWDHEQQHYLPRWN